MPDEDKWYFCEVFEDEHGGKLNPFNEIRLPIWLAEYVQYLLELTDYQAFDLCYDKIRSKEKVAEGSRAFARTGWLMWGELPE